MDDVEIEGKNPILEALRRDIEIVEMYVDSRASVDKKLGEILSIASTKGIQVRKVDRRILEDMTLTGVHRGIIARAKSPSLPTTVKQLLKFCRSKQEDPFLVLIDEVVYDQNLGAVVRTANAAGVHGIVIPRTRKRTLTPEVIRISTGAALFTPIIQENLNSALKTLRLQGVYVIGADMDGKNLHFNVNLRGSIAFVLGGEHKGISRSVKKRCDQIVTIPMYGTVSSLNLSVACSILLYEKLRQERS